MKNNIPAGYWRDHAGRLIPESQIKPIDQALAAKLDYNRVRADHQPQNRAMPGGKRF